MSPPLVIFTTPFFIGGAPPAASTYVNAVMLDGPVGYWRFAEGSGVAAADRSGNASSLVVASTIIWSASPIVDEGTFAIKPTSSLFAITGVGDSPIADGASTFTMEIWFNDLSTVGGRQYLMTLPETAGTNGADIAMIASTLEFRVNTTVGLVVATATPYPLATDNHVVLAYTGSAVTGYLNGVLVASTSHTGALNHAYQRCTIGSFSPSFAAAFTDRLDEPALYASALSASRILAHYNAGI